MKINIWHLWGWNKLSGDFTLFTIGYEFLPSWKCLYITLLNIVIELEFNNEKPN